jgi:hypothetical protein
MSVRALHSFRQGVCIVALAGVAWVSWCGVASANVEAPGVGWEVYSTTLPTDLKPFGKGLVAVQPVNIGAASSAGEVRVVDTLPAGVVATNAGEITDWNGVSPITPNIEHGHWACSIAAGEEENSVVSCHNTALLPSITGGGGPLAPAVNEGIGRQPAIGIAVKAAGGTEGVFANQMRVEGGGAATGVNASDPLVVGPSPASFGLGHWNGWFSNANGTLDTQAGSVPYTFSLNFDLNNALQKSPGSKEELAMVGGEMRDIVVGLPPGLVGNPYAVPQCTRRQFDKLQCSRASIIGNIRIHTTNVALTFHVFNMVPPLGKPALFGFNYESINIFIEPEVRTGRDYGVDSVTNNSPQKDTLGAELTLWGVPEDPTHNVWREVRDGGCTVPALEPGGECWLGAHPDLKPFLRVPTSCGAPQGVSVTLNGWKPVSASFTEPISFLSLAGEGTPSGFTACGRLPFAPGIEAKPTTSEADSATGLQFDLHVPQPEPVTAHEEEVKGEKVTVGAEPALHEADLKDTVLSFPAGVAIDPSSADGLGACSETQVGFTGFAELDKAAEPGVQTPQFTPGPVECPDSSKLGTVEVDTPLINHPLPGAVYLAKQGENPYASLLALYLIVDDPISGVVVKVPALVQADPQSGQLTVLVKSTPQVPFEDFKINLFLGSRAALTTPATCGTYTTTSLLTPWSSPEGAEAQASGTFEITEAPGGGACAASPAQEPNDAVLSAGTFTPIAGAYSPFVLKLSREDGSQRIGALSATLPQGLVGKLAGVALCPQANIEAAEHRGGQGEGRSEQTSPSCPAASEIGTAHVGAGAGAPYYVTGHAYLAGPYKGAPFSIVVITPALAGPFDLGSVVVRNALFIDPVTTQVTVVSDPLPKILYGIPIDIRSIEVEVTRHDFTLNPTSCEKTQVTGSATGETSQVALSTPFQVGGCTGLPFKPAFSVATQAKTSKLGGASLEAKIEIPPPAAGSEQVASQANTRFIKVELPKQMPSRLTTLQKACTAVQFDANPAGCPAASTVGHASVITPILPMPLEGPAYFVSNGNAKFPELVLVLQGYGVTVDVHGETFISKAGITSTTFAQIPDVPYTSVTLTLPEGPYSALAAVGNLCTSKLIMPTVFRGQNGAVFKQSTQIAVTGCTQVKTKKPSRAQKLHKALKVCHKYKNRHRRTRCEAEARKRYGPSKRAKKTKKKR